MNSRVTTSMVQRNVLADINKVNNKLSQTELQAATGQRINRPSDDPYGTARAMALRNSLDGTSEYISNIQDAEGWQEETESALSSISDYFNRAKDLAVQGANGTNDQTSLDGIADEIDQICDGMKEAANSQFGNSYIMSGTATNVAPYAVGTDDTYHGNDDGINASTPGVLREIGPGVTLSINTVADEVLGSGQTAGDGKMLNTLRDLSAHLRAGDTTAVNADLGKLDANQDTLLEARSRNGARTNRLESAEDRMTQIQQSLTKQLMNVQDADFAQTMIDFNSQSTALNAALKAGAGIVQTSLMDFLGTS